MTGKIGSFTGKYRFLSNFYPIPSVKLDGIDYPTVEHAYQAAKSLNPSAREFVRNSFSPGEAKRRGRTIQKRPDWNTVKLGIMEDLVRQKFSVEPLKSMLLDTGESELEEGNSWGDAFWGVCRGVGHNHLGKILMKIRQEMAA